MAKLSTYVMVTAGLMILLSLSGLPTTIGWVLGQLGVNLGNIQNFSSSGFYVAMFAAITLLISVTGIRIGIFGTPSTTTFAAAGAAVPLAVLIGDMISIVTLANSGGPNWVGYIVFLILVPFVFGYMITLFDWVRGGSA